MTGFKEGASTDDPFADEEPDEVWGEDSDTDALEGADEEEADDAANAVGERRRQPRRDELPWIYRRESITSGRAKTVQLHLRQATVDSEREARADLQRRVDQNLAKADFREAVFRAGLGELDDAIETLRDWGYDIE